MRLLAAMILSGLSGFIALSYEIVWFRVYLYASGGAASSFAGLLGAYLAGVAAGAFAASALCREGETGRLPLKALFWLLLLSNAAAFLTAPLVSFCAARVPLVYTYIPAAFSAALLGVTFPLVSHYGVNLSGRVGYGVALVYMSNIIGSTLGSLVTGFWFFELFDLSGVSVILAFLGIAMALVVLPVAGYGPVLGRAGAVALVLAACLPSFAGEALFDGFYERLFYKDKYTKGVRFGRTVTNRSGVINVTYDGVLYGGGIYDGIYSTNLVADRNMIVRAYAIPAFHPSPEEVLFIGLGSGSWLKVVAANPAVKRITVVEINPGYMELLGEYPSVSSVLDDPKITYVVDDGRRWLRRNPERKFDLVVANATFNWRMNSTNLLSVEFLEMIRKHLKPGGIHYYNTTGSGRIQKTGATVFPYALRVINFLAVSDSLFAFDTARWKKSLEEYVVDGESVLPFEGQGREDVLRSFIGVFLGELEGRESILSRTEGVRLATDDNMGTEWEPH